MKKVVVTGMGVVSPLGNDMDSFRRAIFAGKPQIGHITRFPVQHLPTQIAGEVTLGEENLYSDIKITFALLAARQAMHQAFGKNADLHKIPSLLSIGIGLELFSLENLIALKMQKNISKEELCLNTPSDVCTHLIASEFHIDTPPMIHISACAAGTDAIGSAFKKITRGDTKVALAGGTDSMINPMGVAGFCRIGAMSTKNATPEKAIRPFDKDRDGFVMGEGAGFIVLEEETFALERGAKPLATISGYGNSLDAYSMSDPHPEGKGALLSMKRALHSAKLTPQQVSAVNVHGTGTIKNDVAEAFAIRDLLGERFCEVPVFATKSLMGHLISAAGAVEIIASILCLQENKVHISASLENVGEGCELCHVQQKPISMKLQHILKNSFGFGGQNASLIVSKAVDA